MRILIAYASTHGATAAIAGRVADHLRTRGAGVVVGDVRALARDASGFDAIIVGAPLRGGRYPRSVERFVRENLTALRSHPSAFFSVGLWSLSRIPEHRAAARQAPRRFLARVGWQPDRVEVIAGGASFSSARLGFLGRRFLRGLLKNDLGDLDSTRDYSFTDWDQVEAFADAFVRTLSPARRPLTGSGISATF